MAAHGCSGDGVLKAIDVIMAPHGCSGNGLP